MHSVILDVVIHPKASHHTHYLALWRITALLVQAPKWDTNCGLKRRTFGCQSRSSKRRIMFSKRCVPCRAHSKQWMPSQPQSQLSLCTPTTLTIQMSSSQAAILVETYSATGDGARLLGVFRSSELITSVQSYSISALHSSESSVRKCLIVWHDYVTFMADKNMTAERHHRSVHAWIPAFIYASITSPRLHSRNTLYSAKTSYTEFEEAALIKMRSYV